MIRQNRHSPVESGVILPLVQRAHCHDIGALNTIFLAKFIKSGIAILGCMHDVRSEIHRIPRGHGEVVLGLIGLGVLHGRLSAVQDRVAVHGDPLQIRFKIRGERHVIEVLCVLPD